MEVDDNINQNRYNDDDDDDKTLMDDVPDNNQNIYMDDDNINMDDDNKTLIMDIDSPEETTHTKRKKKKSFFILCLYLVVFFCIIVILFLPERVKLSEVPSNFQPRSVAELEAYLRYEELAHYAENNNDESEPQPLQQFDRKKIDFSKLKKIFVKNNENFGLKYNTKNNWMPHLYIQNSMFILVLYFIHIILIIFLSVIHIIFILY